MNNSIKTFLICFFASLAAESCYHNKKEWGFSFLCWYNNTFEMGWNPEEVCRGK